MNILLRIGLFAVGLLHCVHAFSWQDTDNDGVPDLKDACPHTAADTRVDAQGCEKSKRVYLCLPTMSGETYPAQCKLNESVSVHFRFARAEVDYSQWRSIASIATWLTEYPIQLCIVGHTDNVGTAEFNQVLSYDRALSVKKVLVEDYGFSPSRFCVAGKGSIQPIASNASAAGRAQNRRAEFIVQPR